MNSFKLITIVLATLTTTAAYADGFTCEQPDGNLTVKVYNNTQATSGTRSAAIMVISDQSINYGDKTIARFTDINGTLGNSGATYAANVDLRFNDSNKKGRNIGGTKLGEVDTITLDVAFSYARPLVNGEETKAELRIAKRDGSQIGLDMQCTRYLKN